MSLFSPGNVLGTIGALKRSALPKSLVAESRFSSSPRAETKATGEASRPDKSTYRPGKRCVLLPRALLTCQTPSGKPTGGHVGASRSSYRGRTSCRQKVSCCSVLSFWRRHLGVTTNTRNPARSTTSLPAKWIRLIPLLSNAHVSARLLPMRQLMPIGLLLFPPTGAHLNAR